ncbi:unnamed protein product [Adineta ricciae]|uniref:Uncharacterized protein n=1 Tax=Adineta ricciae TaxID=249248 RepID=A0A813T1F6_ADIRI|nr:unnamed protein product [Adineta ricciae]CAF0804922.1 unnamed protein product [Adineta ricciae]
MSSANHIDKVKTYLLAASGRRTIRNTPWIDDVPSESFTLPKYEVEILDKVKHENTVACLHSNTSKNFLIINVIREYSYGIQRKFDEGGQRIICLTMEQDPVALAEMIHRHLPVDVGSFGIEHGVLLWKKDQWLQEMQIRNVFVMHPAVFHELLNRNYIEFSHIKLLILDECHQAIRDHAYGSILRQYKTLWERNETKNQLPRLFSITVALLKTHCTSIQLEERIENLHQFFCSTVFTATDLISRPTNRVSKIPRETIVVCEKGNHQQPEISKEIIQELQAALEYINKLEAPVVSSSIHSDENSSPLTIPRQVLTECLRLVDKLGIWALLRSSLPIITQLERLSSIAVEQSSVSSISAFSTSATSQLSLSSPRAYSLFLDWICTLLRLWRSRIKTALEALNSQTLIEQYTTPKLRSLFDILKRFQADATNTSNRRWSALIFVDRKQETAVLNAILKDAAKRFADEYSFIRPNFLVGYSTMQPTDDPSTSQHIQPMDSRKQEEVMRKFRLGENNVIVALSSLEELKDIPDCNLVIRFNVPTNYRSYVQSKGKARAQTPHFFMLAEQEEYDTFLTNLNSFKGIEQVLMKEFHEINNPLPSSNIDRERSPNAIEVINRYCARLPCDALTTLVPSCKIKKYDENQYQCILSLPVNSPARTTITGPIRSTVRQAKLSTAKRLCEHLLQAGELNEHLLPETREQFYLRHSIIDDEDIAEWGSYVDPNPKPGSVQRKQLYNKAIAPEPLSTEKSSEFFVYCINGGLTTPLTQHNEQQKLTNTYTNQSNSNRIGVLSANYLLEIPAFSLFSRAGEETYNLDRIMKNVRFTSDEYRMLQTVHYYLFSSILGFDRPLVNFNPEQSQSHLIIILLKKDSSGSYSIDWKLTKDIISFIQSMYLQKYTPDNPYVFNADDFNQTCIVLPSYRRSTQPQYYIVNSIDTNKNPLSPFPSISTIYDTFSSYYEIKYELRLTNKSQPLLCVSHTSHRLNQLIPRYMNFKMMKSSTASNNRNTNRPNQHTKTNGTSHHHHHQGVFLIPELVIIHPVNAQLWQGIIALPSMLYRINCLILVEQLRRTVALETGVGAAWAPEDGQFDRLTFDWDEKKEAQFSALLDNNDAFFTDEPIDPNWNFEISVWNENDIHSWTNDSAWLEAKDRCIMINAADFEDGDFDDDIDLDDDEEDDLPHSTSAPTFASAPLQNNNQSTSTWSTTPKKQLNESSSLDDDEEEEDEEYDDEEKKPTGPSLSSTNKKQEKKLSTDTKVTNYHIDLPRLHEDLKTKSKKFLSKLMASTQPTTDPCKSEEVDVFSSLDTPTTNSKNLVEEKSNYLTNVQIEEPTHVPCPPVTVSPSVIHFEPTPFVKRLLNIEDVIHDDENEEPPPPLQQQQHEPVQSSMPLPSTQSEIIFVENGYDSGIIDDFSEPLNINLDFEYLPESHPGPSPALLLQALTLSNAGDGFDLERLETVGDSFLKQAVTVYIYCTYTQVHEGKLSFFRSKIVSNYNLYKLGKRKGIGEYLISTKFEPFENWVPPLFTSGSPTEYGLLSSSGVELWTKSESTTNVDWIELQERREQRRLAKLNPQSSSSSPVAPTPFNTILNNLTKPIFPTTTSINEQQWTPSYDRRTQHLISDKSIADAVEALIGAYLIASGPKAALRFMAWLGVRIFPRLRLEDGTEMTGELPPLPSPVDYTNPSVLSTIQSYDFDRFEKLIGYRFHQRAYLIQAFTHASYSYNTITDCYQRLEFLGDAVLDYVITRYLYEHPKRHSPGELTDLRSALVNNNIFAYIAVKYDFHKYFRCHSNELFSLIDKFVQAQKDKSSWCGFDECNLGDDDDENDEFFYYDFLTSSASNNKDTYSHAMTSSSLDDEHLSNSHEEQDDDTTINEPDEWEETEVPKCLGDIFESVAGAIFLDSNKSFNTVWKIYYRMLKPFIEKFTTKVPKSPIRELLELEPETVKFEKPERLLDGRIRVTVEIISKGRFKGVGRNYRIAKNAAAKCALKNLRRLD